jgi:hypothetical protein
VYPNPPRVNNYAAHGNSFWRDKGLE